MQPLLKAYSTGIKAFLTDPWVQGTFALILLGKAITNIQEELFSTQKLISEVHVQASKVRQTAWESMSMAKGWIDEANDAMPKKDTSQTDFSDDAQSIKFSDPYKDSLPE